MISHCPVNTPPLFTIQGSVCNREIVGNEGAVWFKWGRSSRRSRFELLVHHFDLLQP